MKLLSRLIDSLPKKQQTVNLNDPRINNSLANLVSEGNAVTNLPTINPPVTQNQILHLKKSSDDQQKQVFESKIAPEIITQMNQAGFSIATDTRFSLLSHGPDVHRNKSGQQWTGIAVNDSVTNSFKVFSSNDDLLILHYQRVVKSKDLNTNSKILESIEKTGAVLNRSEHQFLGILRQQTLSTPLKVRDAFIFTNNPNYAAVHNYPRFHTLADNKYEYVHLIFDIRDPHNPIPVAWNLYEGVKPTENK